MYGPVVRNLKFMVIEMIGFAIFIIFVVIAFSSYLFTTKICDWPWSCRIKNIIPYLFNAMLGNYNSGDFDVTMAGW